MIHAAVVPMQASTPPAQHAPYRGEQRDGLGTAPGQWGPIDRRTIDFLQANYDGSGYFDSI
jgi:hypothetical protein